MLLAACDQTETTVPTRYGQVVLQSNSNAEMTRSAVGRFYRYDPTTSDVGTCDVVAQTPDCNIWACAEKLYTTPFVPELVSAGDLTVEGTLGALAFSESEPGTYVAEPDFEGPLWAGGESLTARVAGTPDFPAIEATVVTPPPLTVTAPELPAEGEDLALDGLVDFEVAWSEPVAKDVAVYVTIGTRTMTTDGTVVVLPGVDCGYYADAKKGVVPSSALGLLPAPKNLLAYQVDLLTFSSVRARSSDDTAQLTLRTSSTGFSSAAAITFKK